jgi:hypothetical protein
MAAVTISANLDERDAKQVRVLAEREHRSVSSFVASAVVVFSAFPRDLRDSLLELRVDDDALAFRTVIREMAALVARSKFDLASRRLAAQKRLPEINEQATEADILDEASAIVRGI